MSERNTTNHKTAGNYRRNKGRKSGWIAVLLVAALLIGGLILYFGRNPVKTVQPTTTAAPEQTASEAAAETLFTQEEVLGKNLGYGIYVTDVGPYTGMFMEDGSDEILANILMIIVKNEGEQDIQFADISMEIGDQKAQFSLTTLPVGKQMVLLEKNRMTWDSAVDYSSIYPMVENIVLFQEPVSAQADRFEIDMQDGLLNVRNISGQDIPGKIVVYYKNAADDLYYGGITYRVSIEGGLTNNEIRQVLTKHASKSGSEVVFITVEE